MWGSDSQRNILTGFVSSVDPVTLFVNRIFIHQ
jgi:hypothetical protein